MEKDKIAILIDSGTDVPQKYIDEFGMYMVPLGITYADRSYRDKVDISATEVFDRLTDEIPTTSLPSMGDIEDTFDRIKADGFRKVIAVTISSGLSGTYNSVRLVADMFPDIETCVVDSKNIGIGAGLTAIAAGHLIRSGLPLMAIFRKLHDIVNNTAVFFCVDTLTYLEKGGRISHAAAAVGRVLNLKPIISCDKNGVYQAVAKVRGRAASLVKAIDLAKEFASRYEKYSVAVAFGGTKKETIDLFEKAASTAFPNVPEILSGTISPALVVHTGPGLVGLCVQKQVF